MASGVITTAYIDGPMDGKTTYYYVVAAVGANGTTSMNSNEVVYKALPQSPKLFGTYNGTSARLTWTKANGAERYTLYRSTVSGGPYYAIAENLLTNVFEDTNLTSGTVYYYVVKAINELGESEYSNEVAMGEGVTVAAKFNPDDDEDGDGLTNVDELKYATSLKKNDSDGDGLSDGYEVKKGTNPLVPDTDNDGIYDGAEVVMGTDPLTKNPLTSAEKYAVSEDGKVFVRALSDANILIAPLQVKRSDNVFINSLKGIVGKAIEITAGGFDIKKAEIVVNYDEAELNGVEENNLMLYYVNYDKKILEPLEDVVVDTVYNRVSGKTEHFSTFLLGDKNMPVDLSKVDIVFVLDNSGSMSSNDPNYYRIEATKKFIQNIDELNNRVGLVDFDSSVSVRSNLTSDKSKLLQALNAMRWTGGSTNIGGGLKAALGLFDQEQSKKIIVLLSDGYHNTGIHPNDVLPELIKQEIVVNTIALGKDCDRELLHDIADKTKGGYFYVDNTGGLSQEDVDKQIELIYEKLTKWITLQKEAEKNLKPQEVLSIEYNDVGLDNEEFHKWITTAMTNLLTGNYMEEFDDISIEGNGPEFKFVRYYNSFANQQKTIIGKGFRTNFDSKLTKVAGVGIVQAGVLNVREGPNVNTKKIGYLTKGTKVQIEEDGNKNGSGWHRIVYKGKSAYICAAYVKELNNGIEVTYPSGSMIVFVDDNGDGIYLSDSNKADKVVLSGNEYILIQRDLTRYVFDKSGKLIKIGDRNENYITIEYSGEKISAARDVFGRKLEFIFQGDNLVCIRENIKGKIGRKVEFVYDDKDRLIKVIGVDGAETRYEYDEKDRLKRIIDANGHQVVRNEYDILGRIVRQYDGEDIIRFFIYDDEDRVRYYIDENGNESMVVFNEELKPIKERNALGGGCDYKYEINDGSKWIDVTTPDLDKDVVVSGLTREKYQELKEKGSMTKQVTIQIIKTSPSLETAKTTQIYDGRGNIIQVIDAYGNSIKMKYDNNNNLIEQTDRIGATTKYIYDAEGINLIEKIDPLGNKERYEYYSINSGIKLNGLLAKYIDKNGNETRYYYEDEYNNLTRVVDAEGYETKYEYDQLGRKIKEINERGYVTRFEYDPEGRITKEIDAFGKTKVYVYDKVGNLIEEIDRLGNKTRYVYDDKNRLIKEIDAMGGEYQYFYDPVGNKIKEIDPEGRVTKYTYDELNRLVEIEDAEGNKTKFKYDLAGRKISEVNALGKETRYEYDLLGRLTKVIDPLGKTRSYQYNAEGYKISETNKNGATTSYVYDLAGRLITAYYPDGTRRSYNYDNNGNVISIINPKGYVTKYYYDKLNRVIKVEDSNGKAVTYEYDGCGNVICFKDKKGRETRYEYDALDRVKRVIAPNGAQTEYEYDAEGRVVKVTDAKGRSEEYMYDELGRVVVYKDKLGNVIKYAYDKVGNRTQLIDRRGNATKYEYDKLNRVVKVIDAYGNESRLEYDAVGNNIAKTDRRGNTTKYEYDANNRLVTIIDPYGNKIRFEYDGEGNVICRIDARGNRMYYSYDGLNRLRTVQDNDGRKTVYEYDENGNIVKIIRPDGKYVTYRYDSLDRLVRVTQENGAVTEYRYDEEDNLIEVKDGNGNITRYEYNEIDRPVKVIDAIGNEERYSYDLVGNIVYAIDKNGVRIEYSYDQLDRVVHVKAGGVEVRYSYDEEGNRVQMSDKTGINKYEYDKLNRLIRKIYPDGKSIEYEYDQEGNVIKVKDPSGYVTQYKYDKMNRLEEVITSDGSTRYSYDENGNVKSIEYPNKLKFEYEYDSRNLLKGLVVTARDVVRNEIDKYYTPSSVIEQGGGTSTYIYKYEYGYDDNGNMIYKQEPIGRTEYKYDEVGRVAEVKDRFGRLTRYEYDNVGNRIKEIVEVPTGISRDSLNSEGLNIRYDYGEVYSVEKTYTYDKLNRLLSIESRDREGNIVGVNSYGYDNNGNLIRAEERWRTRVYKGQGSKVVAKEIEKQDLQTVYQDAYTAENVQVQTSVYNSAYSLDNSTVVISVYDSVYNSAYNLQNSSSEQSITVKDVVYETVYEDVYEIEEKIKVSEFRYDELGRMVWAKVDNNVVEFEYDGDGLRTKKITANDVKTYYWSGSNLIYESDATGKGFSSIWGLSMIGRTDGSNTEYFMKDGHGDVLITFDKSGQRKNIYEYDLYGNVIKEIETGQENPIRYAGYYYDKELEWYYLKTRYYDSRIGRFVKEDGIKGDITDPESLNLYTYCTNNPVNLYDPDGEFAIVPLLVGLAVQTVSGVLLDYIIDRKNFNLWKSIGTNLVVSMVGIVTGGIASSIKLGTKITKVAPKVAKLTERLVRWGSEKAVKKPNSKVAKFINKFTEDVAKPFIDKLGTPKTWVMAGLKALTQTGADATIDMISGEKVTAGSISLDILLRTAFGAFGSATGNVKLFGGGLRRIFKLPPSKKAESWDAAAKRVVAKYLIEDLEAGLSNFGKKCSLDALKGINLGRILGRAGRKFTKYIVNKLEMQKYSITNVSGIQGESGGGVLDEFIVQNNKKTGEDVKWTRGSGVSSPATIGIWGTAGEHEVGQIKGVAAQGLNFSWSIQSKMGADLNLGAVRGGEPRTPTVDLKFGYMAPMRRMIVPRVGRVLAY